MRHLPSPSPRTCLCQHDPITMQQDLLRALCPRTPAVQRGRKSSAESAEQGGKGEGWNGRARRGAGLKCIGRAVLLGGLSLEQQRPLLVRSKGNWQN